MERLGRREHCVQGIGSALAVALLLSLLALLSCVSEEKRFRHHRERAHTLLGEGKEAEAIDALRQALRLRPGSAAATFELAELFERRGEDSKALYLFLESHRLDPSNSDAALSAAELLSPADPERARRLIEAVIQREPANPTAYLRRSQLALGRGELAASAEDARRAAATSPDDPELQHHLGRVLKMQILDALREGRPVDEALYQASVRALDRAAALQRENWVARLERVWVLSVWPGHRGLAREEAWKVFRSAFAEAPPEALSRGAGYQMAKLAEELGDDRLYLFTLQNLVRLDPGHLAAWARLAELEDEEGSPAAGPVLPGERTFRRLLERRPGDPRSHIVFASYLEGKGRPDDAIAALERAVDQGVDPPRTLGALLGLLLRLGRHDQARRVSARMQDEYAGHPRTAIGLGQLALVEGRFGDAASAIEASERVRESPEGQEILAVAEFEQGNLSAAAAAVARALRRPGVPSVALFRLRARIQYASRDWIGALRTYAWMEGVGVALTPPERLLLAKSRYRAGDAEGGRRALQELLAEPDPLPGAVLEFVLREGRRDRPAAKRLLEEALKRSPTHPGLLELAVQLDMAEGRPELGLKRLDHAVRIGGGTASLLALRARYRARAGRLEEAETDALRAFEASPEEPGLADLLLAIYRERGRLNELLERLERDERLGALSAERRLLLGRAHLAAGDRRRARTVYEAVLEARPGSAIAMNDLAYLLAERGEQLDRALRLAQAASRSDRRNPNLLDTLGYVYLKQGRFENAAQYFRSAIALGEASPKAEIHYHLAAALQGLGEAEASREQLERALSLNPSFDGSEVARRQLEALADTRKATRR